jgi:hypothetical protein
MSKNEAWLEIVDMFASGYVLVSDDFGEIYEKYDCNPGSVSSLMVDINRGFFEKETGVPVQVLEMIKRGTEITLQVPDPKGRRGTTRFYYDARIPVGETNLLDVVDRVVRPQITININAPQPKLSDS